MTRPRTPAAPLGAMAATLLLLAAAPALAQAPAPVRPAGTPCHVPGVTDRAACHAIAVPLDRTDPGNGRTVELHVAVLPARAPKPAESALFLLAGGPGQAATEYGALVSRFLEGVRETRDIVLMDQRGTGRSGGLSCALVSGFEDSVSADALPRAIERCRADWNADLTAFDTLAVVEDVEHVRRTLGYPSLDLWGGSWGTRTALLYMRTHPSSVRSAVLDGVTPPHRRLLADEPGFSQAALDATFKACAEDAACAAAFPDLEKRFADWLRGFEAPRAFDIIRPDTGRPGTLTLERDSIAQVIRGALYTPGTAAQVPFAIDRMMAGDATALVTLGFNGMGLAESMYIGATLSSLCREEVQRTPSALPGGLAGGSFTGTSWYAGWVEACRDIAVRPLPDGYDAPVMVDVPVLILSGALDPITPPAYGEEALKHLPRAWHIVAPAAGHNVTVARCADDIVADFIRAADGSGLDASCLKEQRRPPFAVGPTGPKP